MGNLNTEMSYSATATITWTAIGTRNGTVT